MMDWNEIKEQAEALLRDKKLETTDFNGFDNLDMDKETFRVYVGNAIFWWRVDSVRAEELRVYYEKLYPKLEVRIVKNEEKRL